MVMETTLRRDVPINELRALGTQLQTLANEIHLSIKCTVKDGRLIVLGQHAGDAVIHSATVLQQLEQTIQSLQLQFTQQVRLYLRVTGQKQPYAHHRFSLVPPSPHYRKMADKALFSVQANASGEESFLSRATMAADTEPSGPTSLKTIAVATATTQPIATTMAVTTANSTAVATTVTAKTLTATAIAPPPAPPLVPSPASGQQNFIDEQPWIVGDDELTSLVQQLTADPAQGKAPKQEDSAPLNPSPLNRPPLSSANRVLADPVAVAPTPTKGKSQAQLDQFTSQAVLENGFIPQATQLQLPETQGGGSGAPNMTTLVPLTTAEPIDACGPGTHTDMLESEEEDQPLALPAVGMASSFQDFTYETSQRLRELSYLFRTKGGEDLADPKGLVTAHVEGEQTRRVAIATASMATFGIAFGLYGATRPCVVGYCQALGEATTLGEKSTRLMQQAQTWSDIELTLEPLSQAIETLEPIPTWSSHQPMVQEQQQVYSQHLEQLNRLMAVEQTIQQADQMAHQTVYTAEDLQTVRSLWTSAIQELEAIPTDSPLYNFAQAHLTTYHPNLTQAQEQMDRENAATAILETAKEAAQLAQARQGIAQTLENWQFARVTWIVALDRLNQVPPDTLAATEAQRLQSFYQSGLNEVNQRVEQENAIATALGQATQQAELAVAAEKRHDWTRAIADWTTALNHVQNISIAGSAAVKIEELQTHYQNSLNRAQEQLTAQAQIEGELKQSCIGELQLCHILSIGQPIKLQLDEAYLDAINTARDSNNYNLKAVVTDHQLLVRQSLDRIANSFNVQIEVYNSNGGLLERHMPNSNG